MDLDRRHFVVLTAASLGTPAAVSPARAAPAAAPISALGMDARQFGVRPGSPDDQSRVLQRAIDEAARSRIPLALAPGSYRAGNLKLPASAALVGARGAARLILTEGPALIAASGSDHITLSGLVLDGGRRPLPERNGLLQLESCQRVKIADCEITGSGRNGIVGIAIGGELIDTIVADTADAAIHVLDSRGFIIARNTINGAGNNGIQVWRSAAGSDGTIVVDNRIENIDNRAGGSGQYGNAVNVFRAGNVIVRGNRIDNCAFSGVRGNAASGIQIDGNSIGDVREVAIYAEFGFEGALIASNSVDGAAIGVAVTNFNEGGRLAVVQGNLIRNLLPKRPSGTDASDGAGIGISVEADAAVTGNLIESAPTAGIMLGFGHYLRDVAATGNVVRKAGIGIAVSVVPGAGTALIANNIIAEARRGAIVGMARSQPVTGDLAKAGVERYAHLTVSGNLVR
jgi:uncharacterized secreted repeat protein (TIGR03808 family)